MSTQWNEETIPSLTLEPDLNDAPELAVAEETAMQQTQPEAALTPEEQKIVDDFAAKIDVENTTQILQYGAGTQKKMADFSDTALANVRTQDLGEVGDLITSVVGELKGFDEEEVKGLFGFFRKQANKLETMKARYAKAETVEGKLAGFPDAEKVSDYAADAMAWAVEQSLINGISESDGKTYLAPQETATRAQIAVILMRYLTAEN